MIFEHMLFAAKWQILNASCNEEAAYENYLKKVLPIIGAETRQQWLNLIASYKREGTVPFIISIKYQNQTAEAEIVYTLVHKIMNKVAPKKMEIETADTYLTSSAVDTNISYIIINEESKQKFIKGLLLAEPFLLECNNEDINIKQFEM